MYYFLIRIAYRNGVSHLLKTSKIEMFDEFEVGDCFISEVHNTEDLMRGVSICSVNGERSCHSDHQGSFHLNFRRQAGVGSFSLN